MRPVFSQSKFLKTAFWKYVISSMRRAIPMVDVFHNGIMSSQDEVLNEINLKFLNILNIWSSKFWTPYVSQSSCSLDLIWPFINLFEHITIRGTAAEFTEIHRLNCEKFDGLFDGLKYNDVRDPVLKLLDDTELIR